MAADKYNKETLFTKIKELEAFSRIAGTDDGNIIINFILKVSQINSEPYETSKNSGETANVLGKQSVGRALIDKLVEAGADLPHCVFSRKSKDKIAQLKSELNKIIGKGD
jgi:hypothetical protein